MKRATIILSAAALAVFVLAGKGYAQPRLEIIELKGNVYAEVFIPSSEGEAEITIYYTGLEDYDNQVLPVTEGFDNLIYLGEADLFDESRFVTVTITTSQTTDEVSRTWPEEVWEPEEELWAEDYWE